MSLAFQTTASPAAQARPDAIKVMVIDDAVVVRGLVGRWVGEEADMALVGAYRSAREAIGELERRQPDVVVLDIEMPDMDGLTALPLLLEKKRDLVVIMASTLTRRNAEISLKALSLGASDYVPKPESNAGVTTSPAFRRELLDKVRALGRRRLRLSGAKPFTVQAPTPATAAAPAIPTASATRFAAATAAAAHAPGHGAQAFKLRPLGLAQPRALVIGASTGGPQALTTVMKGLAGVIDRAPVFVTQHMPPTFTTILAEHLGKAAGRPSAEAKDGEAALPGRVYVAPGAKHMVIRKEGAQAILRLEDGPPVNFCKPAVDPLFTSAAQVFGGHTLACVLTGMGSDGAHGAGDIVAAGGSVLAQDEATSIVWGMPGAAAQAGWCSAVLPLDQIALKIVRVFSGDRT